MGIDRPGDMTSPLVLLHHDERTRASKCFYMTALSGLYTASAVDVFSMDGPAIYAPEFHRLPFLRAVEHDLFSDYNVVVLAMSEQHVDGPCRAVSPRTAARSTSATPPGSSAAGARSVPRLRGDEGRGPRPADGPDHVRALRLRAAAFRGYRLQLGGRVERNNYMTAERGADGHGDHGDGGHDGHDDEEDLDDEDSPDLRDRQFLGASASVGLLADIGDDSAFVASLRHAHRVPAPQKLFNFGPHLGNYEVGSPGLEPEATRDSISASGTSPTASGAA